MDIIAMVKSKQETSELALYEVKWPLSALRHGKERFGRRYAYRLF
jgi:hypothetical protein